MRLFRGADSDGLRRRWAATAFGWCMLSLGIGSLLLPRQVFNDGDPRPIVGVALVLVFVSEAILVARRDRTISATATIAQVLQVDTASPIFVQGVGESPGPVRVRHFTTATLDRSGHATLMWTPKRRGIFRLRDVRLCIGGPFGLLERTKEIAPNGHGVIVVGPARQPLPDNFEPPAIGRAPDEEDDLHGIRLYVPGDDVRSIHWRLSAREGRPMVTTTIAPVKPLMVVIDLGPVPGPKAERWAEIAAAFLDVVVAGGPVAVTLRDSHGIASVGVSTPNEINAALASAQPGEPVPLDGAAAYVGVWRNDLHGTDAAGLVVLSDTQMHNVSGARDLHQAVGQATGTTNAGTTNAGTTNAGTTNAGTANAR